MHTDRIYSVVWDENVMSPSQQIIWKMPKAENKDFIYIQSYDGDDDVGGLKCEHMKYNWQPSGGHS